MTLKVFFFIALILRLPVYAAVLYLSFESYPYIFFGCEFFLLLDIVLSTVFYRRLMRPLDAVQNALNLLRGQEWNVALRTTGQPEIDRLVEVFNRMMAAIHDQRVLMEEQSHFLSLLVEVSPSGIIVCGFDGSIRMINPAARKMLGVDSPDRRLRDMPDGSELTFRSGDGSVLRCLRRHFLENGVRNTFYIIENVTDTVAKAEKDAYEKLIRLMSHEVNNTVAGLATAMDSLSGIDPDCDEVLAACRDRAIALSRFIGRFAEVARMPEPLLSDLELGNAIISMKPFLESLCTVRNIDLRFDIPDIPVMVKADVHMLEQVFVNIVKNAVESIGSGGVVEISVQSSPPGFIVTDNGAGIDCEKAKKLFTPFFTDKPQGQGIGLTFVREALRRHGWSCTLDTDPADHLTRFAVIMK